MIFVDMKGFLGKLSNKFSRGRPTSGGIHPRRNGISASKEANRSSVIWMEII
jgi:hypothetical protein